MSESDQGQAAPVALSALSWPQLMQLARVPFALAACRADCLEDSIANCRKASIHLDCMAECLLQAIPYSGFPGVIDAFSRLSKHYGSDALSSPAIERSAPDVAQAAGEKVFERVYGSQTSRVLDQLAHFHPQLRESILGFAYGTIMERSEQDLDCLELFGVASLLAQERSAPLFSHLRGARRAGRSEEHLREFVESFEGVASATILDQARAFLDKLFG